MDKLLIDKGRLESLPSRAFFNRNEATLITTSHLPHWSQDGKLYAVTFRLHDALPQQVVRFYMRECETAYGECTPEFKTKREIMLHRKMMEYLDAGHGQCLLRDSDVRFIVERAFEHMNHSTVLVHAYVVMPNHVHAILQLLGDGVGIQQVMHSLKGFTASCINKHLQRQGCVWQREYYDRIIRNRRHYVYAVNYILQNPSFCHEGEYSIGGQAFQSAEDDE